MKRTRDDFEVWNERKENQAKPFPAVFPQMPPRFRRCRSWTTALFVLEQSSFIFMILLLAAGFAIRLLQGESPLFFRLVTIMVLVLFWGLFCRLLRLTYRCFWRCPHCGTPFPYAAPTYCGEELKQEACIHDMEHLRIRYVKPKRCPLVIPSVCPACRAKFFELPEDFTEKDGQGL